MKLSTKTLACFAMLFLALFVWGCPEEGDTIIESPTAPTQCGNNVCEVGENEDNCAADCKREGVKVTIGGGCDGGETSVRCDESSTAEPADGIDIVVLILRDSGGNRVKTAQLDGGCSSAPTNPCDILFTGLDPDTYSVEHSVEPTDGGPAVTATYRNLVVTGG